MAAIGISFWISIGAHVSTASTLLDARNAKHQDAAGMTAVIRKASGVCKAKIGLIQSRFTITRTIIA